MAGQRHGKRVSVLGGRLVASRPAHSAHTADRSGTAGLLDRWQDTGHRTSVLRSTPDRDGQRTGASDPGRARTPPDPLAVFPSGRRTIGRGLREGRFATVAPAAPPPTLDGNRL